MSLNLLLMSVIFSSHAKAAAAPSLVEAVRRNWSTGSAAGCDVRDHDKAMALAKAMDDKYEAIKKIPSIVSQNQKTTYFQVGPAIFREEKSDGTAPILSQTFSWAAAYQRYQEIQFSPVDEKWALLNRDVRALVREDQKRLLGNLNLEISHAAAPVMMKVLSATESCLQTFGCYQPPLDQEATQFVQNNTTYRSFTNLVSLAHDGQKKVDYLQKFRNRVKADYDYFFNFATTTALKRTGPSDFELSLDAGSLRGYESQLETMIKSVWTSDTYRLNIKWVDASQTPGAYRIYYGAGNGGDSEANRNQKIIYLFQGNRFRSLAHEVGHAMGFPDNFFEVWNPQVCQYVTEISAGDIMSEVKTGKATTAEWQTLDMNYPNSGISPAAQSQANNEIIK